MPDKDKQNLTAMTRDDHPSRGQRDDMIEILRRQAQQSINQAEMYLAYMRVLLGEADAETTGGKAAQNVTLVDLRDDDANEDQPF